MTPIDMEFCRDHSGCLEKFHSIDQWEERMEMTIQSNSEEIVKLRIFKAQIIALSIAAQIIGSGAMTLILHFVGK